MIRIYSRSSWGARKGPGKARQNFASIREFFIHWNGTEPKSFRSINTVAEERSLMRSTQNFHMDTRGWSDFAYSYAIMPSGRVYRGRGISYVPASQLNHNTNTASVIVFLGPDDKITPAVEKSIKGLAAYVNRRSVHKVDIRPHSSVTATECPGPHLTALANRI